MKLSQHYAGNRPVIKKVLWRSFLTLPSSFVIGNIVAFLIWAIDRVIFIRLSHSQIIRFLPVAGVAIYFIIRVFRERSSNIVFQNIHTNDNGVTEKSSLPIFLTITSEDYLGLILYKLFEFEERLKK